MLCTRCNNECKEGEKFCPNCGNSLESQGGSVCPNCKMAGAPGEKFCKNCGTSLVSGNQAANFSNGSSEDELIEAYMGSKHLELRNKKFSWCTLFLGMYYLLYRKMYTVALTWYAINFVAVLLLPSQIFYGISLCINLFISFKFGELYYNDAKNKIDKIKAENPNANGKALKDLVASKGGTNIALPIILFIAVSLINGLSSDGYSRAISEHNEIAVVERM